ncbi:hypothetical protein RRG08_057366 [Elysia crispata]|uniref:Uncharacterized protein n=1 Tax=Elysia crispata TaxID=231223 RepID=A0AAE1CZS2_9GAST|nr:hypothetical protein RRG08_057366 [Elysia crispata]
MDCEAPLASPRGVCLQVAQNPQNPPSKARGWSPYSLLRSRVVIGATNSRRDPKGRFKVCPWDNTLSLRGKDPLINPLTTCPSVQSSGGRKGDSHVFAFTLYVTSNEGIESVRILGGKHRKKRSALARDLRLTLLEHGFKRVNLCRALQVPMFFLGLRGGGQTLNRPLVLIRSPRREDANRYLRHLFVCKAT